MIQRLEKYGAESASSEMKAEVEAAGLHVAGIESVNVHDAIKTGSADRDKYIDNYIETLENLGKEDIHLVCYNFMPVFDWTRTELARKRPDGSTVLSLHTGSCRCTSIRKNMFAFYRRRYERNGYAGLGAGTYGKDQRSFCRCTKTSMMKNCLKI